MGNGPKKKAKAAGLARKSAKYLDYDAKLQLFVTVGSSRPNNQNGAKVVRKTASRLKKLPHSSLRPTTVDFLDSQAKGLPLSKMDKGAGLHMAHGVSIAELKETAVELMNSAPTLKSSDTKKRKLMVDFIPDFVTTDASDLEDVKRASRELFGSKSKADRKLTIARMLLRRVNRTSGNFGAGKADLNILVSSRRDQPTNKTGEVFPHVEKRIKLVQNVVKMFNLNHSGFEPLFQNGKEVSSTV